MAARRAPDSTHYIVRRVQERRTKPRLPDPAAAAGFSEQDLDRMFKETPARLVDLPMECK
jgi:hypothetical protein